MDIVIDKSFLQGASKKTLQSLFQNHRILMTFVNFYELLTTSPVKRARCFQRIPAIENPVELVEPVGSILRWEVKNQWPLLNIDHVIRKEQFDFNPRLVNENFQMEEEQSIHMEDLNRHMATRAKEFAEHCSQILIRFPELRSYRPGDNPSQIEGVQKTICTDPEFVRELYSRPDETWPTADRIDEQWALFKWIQIKVMAALDYYRKYGEKEMSSETTRIENEYLDLEYCLIGCLVEAIATQDKGMRKRFLALCPSGKVFT
jgi:hypothetical protein